MSPVTLLLIALGVSADAFAVALGKGLALTRLRWRDALALAVCFGGFQASMPLIGYLVASAFAAQVTAVDHWIAFGLLTLIGVTMIREAFTEEEDDADGEPIGVRELLVLGLATSIDALAVGISLAFVDTAILPAVLTIGATTFVLTLVGVRVGHAVGQRFRGPAEIVGGLILIGIGVRILLDHLGVW